MCDTKFKSPKKFLEDELATEKYPRSLSCEQL